MTERARKQKSLISYIDLDALGEDPSHVPTAEDFKTAWHGLSSQGKNTLKAMLRSEKFCDFRVKTLGEKSKDTFAALRLMNEDGVLKAYYYGIIAQQPSEAAKNFLLKKVIAATTLASMTQSHVNAIVMSDRDHLKDIADKLRTDGDGKRELLRDIIAYGMQVKVVESAMLDSAGVQTAPPIYALADPKMAYSSIQELNRMDHEYGEDDKATSSIESQAARIKRLADQMDKAAQKEAKTRNGIARKLTKSELEHIQDE